MSTTEFFRWAWSPIAALWKEIKGLRTEQIRSVAVVAGIVVMFRGFERMGREDSLTSPFVVVTLICLVMTFGLAWQATSIKGQIAGARFQLGRETKSDRKLFAEGQPHEEAGQE